MSCASFCGAGAGLFGFGVLFGFEAGFFFAAFGGVTFDGRLWELTGGFGLDAGFGSSPENTPAIARTMAIRTIAASASPAMTRGERCGSLSLGAFSFGAFSAGSLRDERLL